MGKVSSQTANSSSVHNPTVMTANPGKCSKVYFNLKSLKRFIMCSFTVVLKPAVFNVKKAAV